MGLEGVLRIELALHEGLVEHVAIASTRPVQASRMLHGMTPPMALERLPQWFSICGTAQACAAAAALERAQGLPTQDGNTIRRQMLLLMETAQEHLWRLFIDGPRWWGGEPLLRSARAARALLPGFKKALFPQGGWHAASRFDRDAIAEPVDALEQLLAQELFAKAPTQWREDAAALRWWATDASFAGRLLQHIDQHEWLGFGGSAPRFLPPLEANWLECRLHDDAGFVAAPTVDGVACETTPLARLWSEPVMAALARTYGTGLATRLTAMLLELAQIPAQLHQLARQDRNVSFSSSTTRPGVGLAQVEAARGRLIHRVELNDDTTIRSYQILAPTEWNFHPRGLLARALTGAPMRDAATAKRQTELFVQVVDPCVGFEVTVRHAGQAPTFVTAGA